MTEVQNNELAIWEEIRNDLVIKDGSEYSVPLSKVFGKGTVAKTESFGGRTLSQNTALVDQALDNTKDLQQIWNRSHSQWMWRHLNLSYHSPHKNMRQIAAEVVRKKQALNEAKWGQIKSEIKIKKIEEQLAKPELLDYWGEVELKVKLAQLQEGMAEGITYIEGAMKDVLSLNDLYEQLKLQVNSFTEEDIEAEETKAHLKRSLVQSIRDVRQSGCITKGEQEYLEQIGVNPMKVQRLMKEYVAQEATAQDWSVTGLHQFVDELTDQLVDVAKVDKIRMDLMGFKSEFTPGMSYVTAIGAPKEE
jgi:hypothetical protein|tara:strand:+ start:3865 stop:4779 length:915 start_codon:yes stop_codon:yes gene_type:complete